MTDIISNTSSDSETYPAAPASGNWPPQPSPDDAVIDPLMGDCFADGHISTFSDNTEGGNVFRLALRSGGSITLGSETENDDLVQMHRTSQTLPQSSLQLAKNRANSTLEAFPESIDVLIVGAGPSGLVLACDLAKRGVDFRIVDINSTHVLSSRANLLLPQSLDALADLGVVTSALYKGHILRGIKMIVNDSVVMDSKLHELSSQFPFILSLEQCHIENLLQARLEELGHKVVRPIAVSRIEVPINATNPDDIPLAPETCSAAMQSQSPLNMASVVLAAHTAFGNTPTLSSTISIGDGFPSGNDFSFSHMVEQHLPCSAVLKELNADGSLQHSKTKTIRCQYIVGSDGQSSSLRRAMDIPLEQCRNSVGKYVIADIIATFPQKVDCERLHIFHDAKCGDTVLVIHAMSTNVTENTWRLIMSSTATEEISNTDDPIKPIDPPTDDEIETCIKLVIPQSYIFGISFKTAYITSCCIAKEFRRSNSFLVGDAAHVYNPTLCQGLNAGIQDSFNLGWKLAAVLNGASSNFLDAYQLERRREAEDTIAKNQRGFEQVLRSGMFVRCCLGVYGAVLNHVPSLQYEVAKQLTNFQSVYQPSEIIGAHRLQAGAAYPGMKAPECRIYGLQVSGGGVEPGLMVDAPKGLQDYLRGGSHTLLLCVRVLPPGTKIRTLFGCERNQEASRWCPQSLQKLSRLGRIVSQSLRGVSSSSQIIDHAPHDLRVVWTICGLVDMTDPKNTLEPGQIKDHVPHRLKWFFTHGSDISAPVYVIVDHQREVEKNFGLNLNMPDGLSSHRSGAALLIRPDHVLAFNAYSGDGEATSGLVDYALHMFPRCK